jgi:hypothetical protein
VTVLPIDDNNMGKLSLSKKKGGEETGRGQKKITGFFPVPQSSSVTTAAASSIAAAADAGGPCSGTALSKVLQRKTGAGAGGAENKMAAATLLSPAATATRQGRIISWQNGLKTTYRCRLGIGTNQCCEFGSGSTGSTCFWASTIRMRIH